MKTYRMDKVDENIIKLLTENARMSVVENGLMNFNEDLTTVLKDELYTIEGIISIDCKLILSRIKVRSSLRI